MEIDLVVDGDIYFFDYYVCGEWVCIFEERYDVDKKNFYCYWFLIFKKKE